MIETYNSEIDRWRRRSDNSIKVDHYVNYDDQKIKWSEHLKKQLLSEKYCNYSDACIRLSLYRPFTKRYLYFDAVLNDRRLLQHLFFSTSGYEAENIVIVVSDIGSRDSFSTLATNVVPDLHVLAPVDAFQCFPFYTYSEDGSNRRENITDWALKQFQDRYGSNVTKWDIFHYVYGLLHHPQYREHYKENIKRDLPHIPLLHSREAFEICKRIGQQLMDLHLNYEQAKEYPLKWDENESVPFSWRVEKMKLTPDKSAVVVNESLTLAGVPQECFEYRLGNRSALEWVIDQYQVSEDKRSGIVSDPNRLDDEEYIVRLVGRVITVSVETVNLVKELEQTVRQEDWMSEIEEVH